MDTTYSLLVAPLGTDSDEPVVPAYLSFGTDSRVSGILSAITDGSSILILSDGGVGGQYITILDAEFNVVLNTTETAVSPNAALVVSRGVAAFADGRLVTTIDLATGQENEMRVPVPGLPFGVSSALAATADGWTMVLAGDTEDTTQLFNDGRPAAWSVLLDHDGGTAKLREEPRLLGYVPPDRYIVATAPSALGSTFAWSFAETEGLVLMRLDATGRLRPDDCPLAVADAPWWRQDRLDLDDAGDTVSLSFMEQGTGIWTWTGDFPDAGSAPPE